MNCATARERLLEADLTELDGTGTGPLAQHLAMCSRCRAQAARIVDGERALARSLAAEARDAASPALAVPLRRSVRPHRWPLLIPALAAAAVVLVLLRGEPTFTEPGSSPVPAVLPPLVQPAPGQDVAVYETDNPNIVIVWTF